MKSIIKRVIYIILGLALALGVVIFMSQKPLPFARGDLSGGRRPFITLYNWEEYTDHSALQEFERQTGIAVHLEEYKTEEDMERAVAQHGERYDVIVCSGSSLGKLRRNKLIQKINSAQVLQAQKVDSRLRCFPDYAVPYLAGTTGLAIDSRWVKDHGESWQVLWEPKYRGRIALLDDVHEVMAILFFSNRLSGNANDAKALKLAEENARRLRDNQVVFSDTWDNVEKLRSGEKWIIQVYNGDITEELSKPNSPFRFYLPKEGYSLWIDHFTISARSPHADQANVFINFMLQPEIAARAANRFHYFPPVKGVEAFITKGPSHCPALIDNKILAKGEFLISDLPSNSVADYERIFRFLKGESDPQNPPSGSDNP